MGKRKNSWQCGMIMGADSEGCFLNSMFHLGLRTDFFHMAWD